MRIAQERDWTFYLPPRLGRLAQVQHGAHPIRRLNRHEMREDLDPLSRNNDALRPFDIRKETVMPYTKRSERESAEGSRSTAEKQLQNSDDKKRRRETPSPSTEKVSGAGPATAEHSKDAKAPKAGRQPGAYVKD